MRFTVLIFYYFVIQKIFYFLKTFFIPEKCKGFPLLKTSRFGREKGGEGERERWLVLLGQKLVLKLFNVLYSQ